MPRKDTLDSVPRLLAVAYYDRKDLHRAHYTFLKLAREATKDALLKGFSHSAECSLDYVQPAYELNIEPPEEGVNARMRKARIMLKNVDAHLPDSLVHLSNKAPCKLVRGDNEADEFEDVDLPPKSELVNVRYHPTGATRSSTTARGVWTGMKTTMWRSLTTTKMMMVCLWSKVPREMRRRPLNFTNFFFFLNNNHTYIMNIIVIKISKQ